MEENKVKILLAEDDSNLGMVLKNYLELNDYDVMKIYFECQKLVYKYQEVFAKIIDCELNENVLELVCQNSQ